MQPVSDLFDMSLSHLQQTFVEFVDAIIRRLGSMLAWPSTIAQKKEIVNGSGRGGTCRDVWEQLIVHTSSLCLQIMR